MDQDRLAPEQGGLQLLDVEIGDWPPLGGGVKLQLGGRKTILVGKNSAGKSLLLEGLARWSTGLVAMSTDWTNPTGMPGRFACDVEMPGGGRIRFEYRWTAGYKDPKVSQGPARDVPDSWDERCSRPDTGATLWEIKQGTIHLPDGTTLLQPGPVSLLKLRHSAGLAHLLSKMPELDHLARLFAGVHLIRAGLPRRDHRTRVVVSKIYEGRRGTSFESAGLLLDSRLTGLVIDLIQARDSTDRLEEFIEMGRRLGIWQRIEVDTYAAREGKGGRREELMTVSVDGIDIGLLSDGTLRSAEILWAALDRDSGKLLLIEEPETGIHPGLLAGLLDTLDAHAIDRQIVVSTHSPQVVSWAAPQELRLVTRAGGATHVRGLSEHQRAQVVRHLHEQTLGEYAYSGALDDDDNG